MRCRSVFDYLLIPEDVLVDTIWFTNQICQFTLLLYAVKHNQKKKAWQVHTTYCYSCKPLYLYALGKWKGEKAQPFKKIKAKQNKETPNKQNKIPTLIFHITLSFHVTYFPLLDFLGWGMSPSMVLYLCDQYSVFGIWIAKLYTSVYKLLVWSSLETSFQHIWLWCQHREMHNTLHKKRNAQKEDLGDLWSLKLLQTE